MSPKKWWSICVWLYPRFALDYWTLLRSSLSSSPRPSADPPNCFLSFARCDAMADSSLPSPLNCISSPSVVHSSDTIRLDMKDVASNRHSRNSLIYPKKRPSPHGISKSHKSPLLPANGLARRTPRSTKVALIQQKQREAQIQALRREGIFLEEEYREEIRYYMQDMEVSSVSIFHAFYSHSFLELLALYYVVYSVNGSTAWD